MSLQNIDSESEDSVIPSPVPQHHINNKINNNNQNL